MSVNQSEIDDCPHDNVEYDPGISSVTHFGNSIRMFCLDCGEEIEAEDIAEDIQWDTRDESTRYELEEEARNPL